MRSTEIRRSSPGVVNSTPWKNWLAIGLFALLWADLIRELGFHWNADQQYAYGWFVPVLTMALLWRRWLIRPDSDATRAFPLPFWLTAMVVVLALFLLPVRIVYEINADWPLPQWLMSMIVVALSLYAVLLAGGWKWVKHFAFPVCFIFVAVQWPYRVEHGLTQHLMRLVASVTVELLSWLNIPALQHGNLIEVSTGVVGVEEACSGIRSILSTLMAGLFLGELYLLSWPRRLLLVFVGVIISFLFNVVRTLFLTWNASAAGLAAMEKWHDAAGLSVFLAAFACLWLLAIWLRNENRARQVRLDQGNPGVTVVPRWFLASVGCWSLLVFGLNRLWYHSHDVKNSGDFQWSVSLHENDPSFHKVELAPRTIHLLAFDQGTTGEWQDAHGVDWTAYFFRWEPRSIESVIYSRIHRPDRCLPASGLREVSDSGVKYFNAAQLELPFHRYIYETGGHNLYVFFCQWEDGEKHQAGLADSNWLGRIRSAWGGRLFLGQQTLELILSGCDNLNEADRAVTNSLPDLIKIDDAPRHAAVAER